MSDSAIGPFSGYLFQFEKALVMLAKLGHADETVSIEMVDDVSIQDPNELVTVTIQSKHSISPNGTTFEDTSTSLWRTIQIWIEKVEAGIFKDGTKFICCTNKKVPDDALVKKMQVLNYSELLILLEALLTTQKEKLKFTKETNPEAGSTIKKVIKLIGIALSKQNEFEIVKRGLIIEDLQDPIEDFYTAVHMTTDYYTEPRKKAAYEEMYGWIATRSKAKWLNATNAIFSKKEFDSRWAQVNSNPAIVSAVFRKKSWLGSIDAQKKLQARNELFVIQIDGIQRNSHAKERKIEQAVLDFLYHEIEVSHIIKAGNFTQLDFDKFKQNCFNRWQSLYDELVLKEIEEYSEEEKNELAVRLFDSIMDKVEVAFSEGIPFTTESRYVHNGMFLSLSNIPEIGWHPEWQIKYKK